ncbi:MAG: hypothetical protein C0413_00865 [Clostridiales bacterium]|nr:hypothetical protein [Clostridiales bacterium]
MKEDRKNQRAAIRGRTKRYLVAVIAVILVLAFSTTALAAKGNGGSTLQANGTDAQSGATQQPPPGNSGNNNGNGNQTNNRNKAKIGAPNLDKIVKAIAALTDETLKADLTALLTAYEDAWAAKQDAVAANETDLLAALTEAITTAKATLDAALSDAGVSLDKVYGVPVEALDGSAHQNRRPVLDADKVLAAIATLPDTNADKATLTGLLNEYQLALAAQTASQFASLSEQARLELAYAVRQAEEALLLASREAGIIGGNGRGQFISGYAFGDAELDVTSILASIAALDDTDENKAKLTALMEAYSLALAAETDADKTALSEAELDALHDATESAEEALIEALELAGIDVPKLQDGSQPRDTAPTYVDDDDDEDEYEPEGDDD